MTDARGTSKVLHMIGNSHIDPVWLWQWPEGYQAVRATFRSALDRMNEYPEFIFTCDSAAYYEWIEEIEPAMFEEIRQRVAEGRWEIVGGWWVEPDCNIPGGESFVRQALVSQRYFLEKFGRIATVGYNVDPFGHNGMLPQLLRRAGMDSYVFMRPGPHEFRLPAPVFWWESPDGSRVLAYRLPHEYCSPNEDLGYHIDKSIAQLPAGWSEMMAFYGVGNHGGGPTRQNLDSIRRLDGAGAMPRLRQSTPRRFFDTVLASDADIPVVTGDLQHHAVGCYSAHSGIKAWMRGAENALSTAEAWATVAGVVGLRRYPRDELARAWKQVLFNQFHDTMCGTAIEPAYDDARDQLGEATSIAARVENVAIQSLSQLIDIPSEPGVTPIVVFNPLAWPVRSLVELEYGGLKPNDGLLDEEGRPVAFQQVQSYATVSPWRSRLAFEAEVPALGYRTYAMTPGKRHVSATALRATPVLLENDFVRLELDPATGRIVHLVLREDGRDVADLADGSRPRAVVIDDTSDTWGHRRLAYRDEVGTFEATSVELVESGPVRGILRVNSRYRDSVLTEDFVVSANRDSIEQRVILDWREKAQLLKIRMPTTLSDVTAAYEIPYGVIERPADGAEEPGQRWIDASGTIDDVDGRLRAGRPERREVRLRHPRRRVGSHRRPKPDLRPSRADRPHRGRALSVPGPGPAALYALARPASRRLARRRPDASGTRAEPAPDGARRIVPCRSAWPDGVIRLRGARARDRRRGEAGRGRGRHRGPSCRDDRPSRDGARPVSGMGRVVRDRDRAVRDADVPGACRAHWEGDRDGPARTSGRASGRGRRPRGGRVRVGVGCRSRSTAAGSAAPD